MLKLLWNAFKAYPALFGVSLLVASSTHAAQTPSATSLPDPTIAATTSQATKTEESAVEPLTPLPQTTVEESSVSELMPSDVSLNLNQADNRLAQQVQGSDNPNSTADNAIADSTKVLEQIQLYSGDNNGESSLEPAVESLTSLPQTTVEKTAVSQLTPSDADPNLNKADSTLAQQVPAADNTGADSTKVLEQIQLYSGDNNGENSTDTAMEQVTNVTQLRDVSPGDWAFEALRSLVERYGCIAGYPDGTYRGNRAMSRYEFAAGLNACLQQVERLIASSTADFVTRGDLETLQRLVQEFQTELTTLGTRVDALDGRVAFLEDHQFSTTTKLNGEAIFAISDLFGGQAANGVDYDDRDNTVFQNQVRLNFDTSFTGEDLLRVRLQARNAVTFDTLNLRGDLNVTREGRLAFDSGTDGSNDIVIEDLSYRFSLGPARVALYANGGELFKLVDTTLNPLDSDGGGSGSISRFGQRNPIYRVGGQNAGAGVILGSANSPIALSLGYLADFTASNPNEKAGLFDGNYSSIAQLTFKPSSAFGIAATYVHSYDRSNLRHGTGSVASQLLTGNPVVSNSYGIEASFAFSPKIILSGWAGYTDAIVIGRGNADIWNYGATLAINDIGRKGSTLGFVVGMEPKLTGSDETIEINGLPDGSRRDSDTGLHIEGFYQMKLTDNISVTPGLIWLTAPGHNDDNDDVFVGTIRTTFRF